MVLAAGASRRFGRPKQLLPLPAGQGILLDRAIDLARCLSRDVRVVAGPAYPLMRYRCQRQPTAWVTLDEEGAGLSASLVAGIDTLGPAVRGVFVMLADQPLLDVTALSAMAKAARSLPQQAMAADYDGRPGVPAYLPRALWSGVRALSGDRGAGSLLADAGATRIAVAGVRQDVDTPADWERIRPRLSQTVPTARQSRR